MVLLRWGWGAWSKTPQRPVSFHLMERVSASQEVGMERKPHPPSSNQQPPGQALRLGEGAQRAAWGP